MPSYSRAERGCGTAQPRSGSSELPNNAIAWIRSASMSRTWWTAAMYRLGAQRRAFEGLPERVRKLQSQRVKYATYIWPSDAARYQTAAALVTNVQRRPLMNHLRVPYTFDAAAFTMTMTEFVQ